MIQPLACAAGRQLSIALAVLIFTSGSFAAVEISDLVQELQHLRDLSKDGVIKCDDAALKRFGAGKQRPYTLYVFLTAKQVLDNPQLMMTHMRDEFGLAAAAVRSGPDPDAAFFVETVFEESPKIFQAVGANQVPYIFRIPGTRKVLLTEGGFAIPDTDKMTFQTMGGQSKYPWPAEVILSFFARTGLVAGEVNRPSIYKSPLFPFMVLGAIVAVLLLFAGMWRSGVLHHPLIYAVGALGIFWFSVSGGMYNIIRGMPMFTRDKNGKIQFFLSSRNAQLGAEGFIVGSGYLIFSACISLLTYAVPRVKNQNIRGTLSYLLVAATMYMAFQLFGVFVNKTGYKINSYLFR